jgi:hypothetical protein
MLIKRLSVMLCVSLVAWGLMLQDGRVSAHAPPTRSPTTFRFQQQDLMLHPLVKVGDEGVLLRAKMTVPGKVIHAMFMGCEGEGCQGIHECPDGSKCPPPYHGPFDFRGNTVYWDGWTDATAPATLTFSVEWEKK